MSEYDEKEEWLFRIGDKQTEKKELIDAIDYMIADFNGIKEKISDCDLDTIPTGLLTENAEYLRKLHPIDDTLSYILHPEKYPLPVTPLFDEIGRPKLQFAKFGRDAYERK